MKIKSVILASVLLAVVFSTVQAQTESVTPVKILPCNIKGMVRVLYVGENAKPVQVKFYDEGDLYTLDVINGDTFENGFVKRYDISMVQSKNFRIQVISDGVSVIYKMTKSQDGKTYEPQLETAKYDYPLVASKD